MSWNLNFRQVRRAGALSNCQIGGELGGIPPRPIQTRWICFLLQKVTELLRQRSSERQHREPSLYGFEYTPLPPIRCLAADKWLNYTVPQFPPVYGENSNSTFPTAWLMRIKSANKCEVLICSIKSPASHFLPFCVFTK